MNLLHLDSSILGDNSASRAISAAIVERLRALHPEINVTYRDLVEQPVPHLDFQAFTGLEQADELRAFLDADIVVIGAGFYNFTIPSQLKAWIDRICVRGKTFAYGETGPVGLVTDKRVIVALARGGVYRPDSPMMGFEHAETLLRAVFRFLGTELEFVTAEGVAQGDEQRREAMAHALEQAYELA
jgi:FMN-dependent NADH-azoreductase